MPHMTNERVRAGLAREEDLSLLHEVSMKTAGVSHLEMCIQCGTCGGSCPAGAISGTGFSDEQIIAQVDGLLLRTLEPVDN